MNPILIVLLALAGQLDLPYKPDGKVGISEISKSLCWQVGAAGAIKRIVGKETTGVAVAIKGFVQKEWDFNDVCFADSTHGWIVGQKNIGDDKGRGVILNSTNGGASWMVGYAPFMNTPDSLLPCLKVYIVKINWQYQGYIDCGKCLLKCRSGDNTWVRIRPHTKAKQ